MRNQRILAVLLSCALILSAGTTVGFAEEATGNGDNISSEVSSSLVETASGEEKEETTSSENSSTEDEKQDADVREDVSSSSGTSSSEVSSEEPEDNNEEDEASSPNEASSKIANSEINVESDATNVPDSKDETNTSLEQEQPFDEAHSLSVEETSIDIVDDIDIDDLFTNVVDVNATSIKASDSSIEIPKTRAGYTIEDKCGSISGTLTDSFDYYIFSDTTDFTAISKMQTDNPNYTMMLGVIDWSTGTIRPTEYVFSANQQVMVNFGAGDYAWVIQSTNGTYGDDYTLQYNMSLSSTDTPLYVTSDLQKLYTIGNQKLKLNGQVQNVDYRYDRDVESGGFWNKLHIYVRDANVKASHVGGVRYYSGLNLHDFPNAILLSVQPGTNFYHSFWQNPPHYHYVDKDMHKNPTPRLIESSDMSYGHYLIYNTRTDRVEEFVSGLIQPWSEIGDRTGFEIY